MRYLAIIQHLISLCMVLLLLACGHGGDALKTLPTETKGWVGADAAYNRPMNAHKRIWLFGDTLIGEIHNDTRSLKGFYRNSVAVETDGKFHYYWGKSNQGVFINPRKKEWYWPADFVLMDGKIYAFMRRMKQTKKDDPFGFDTVGNDIAIVENPQEMPEKWKITTTPLQANNLSVGIAATVQGGDIYLLSDDETPEHGLVLGRVASASIKSHSWDIDFYDPKADAWRENESFAPVITPGAPEASLAFNPKTGKWRAIFSKNGLSRDVVVVESDKMTDGWSKQRVLFSCPEMDWKADYVCYAGKEIYSLDDGLQITYSINSLKSEDLEKDARIYVPRIVSLPH